MTPIKVKKHVFNVFYLQINVLSSMIGIMLSTEVLRSFSVSGRFVEFFSKMLCLQQ